MSKTYLKKEFKDCLAYIEKYWDKIIRKPEKRKINRQTILIPHSYVVPNDKKFNFIFYWDSYFIFQGLLNTKRAWLTKAMVENFAYIFEKYHIIPNFSAESALGRSQPPFFSSMIMEAYESLHGQKDFLSELKRKVFLATGGTSLEKKWLSVMIEIAKREYWLVWLDKRRLYHHSVQGYKLARYGDRDLGYDHSSELESGWDLTSRFYNRASNFLPIDLNSYLYKYERDFAKASQILEEEDDEQMWLKKAKKRRAQINKFMWNRRLGFFFDYGYTYRRQSTFYSLAGFTPLWAGLATKKQAKLMVDKLPYFETDFGLAITAKKSLAPQIDTSKIPLRYRSTIEGVLKPKQWDYPNIWPPLEYLTVVGLLKYGYKKQAKRIMEKSVRAHATLFRKNKTFFEKINGETGEKSSDFHYPTQAGFGWTNAIFYRYIKILEEI